MKFRFHPDAELEFIEGVKYYEDMDRGLGRDVAVEVYAAIERAVAHPHAWAVLQGQVRRSLVRRFPYGVLYAEEREGILILAVMHLHRDPDYWQRRV